MTRALKFIKFCCDEHGEGEEEVLRTPKAHRLRLRMSSAVDKIRGQLNDKWGIGHSGQICYVASILNLLDFQNNSPASVLQNFAVTEVYVKRTRKYLAKDM